MFGSGIAKHLILSPLIAEVPRIGVDATNRSEHRRDWEIRDKI
jgi:hypothetical protein